MKRVLIFITVLVVQIGIIYGIYRWYVGDTGKSSIKNQTTKQSISKEEGSKPKNSVANNIKGNKIKNSAAKNRNQSKNIDIISNNNRNKANYIGKPLIYRYSKWGTISILQRSKYARTGILVDLNNRYVLWAKKARKSVPIASMTKMMTVLLTFEAIKNNPEISLDTVIKVTPEAYRIGGSQVWLDPRESFTLRELLKAIMIKSANDAAYLIGQYLGNGNIYNFIKMMNKRAKEIGMPNAHFSNPDGLPERYSSQDNRASAEGLVFLAERLLQYPLAIKWATTKLAWFREKSKHPTMLTNTNYLVRDNFRGINGLKTGYTARAGFCITATCKRDGIQLIAVVTGFKSRKSRDRFVKNLLNWGFKRAQELSKIELNQNNK